MAESIADAGASFLEGGGAMGQRIRAFDWASTPLGPPRGWPAPLRTMVKLALNSRQPMFLWWGDALIQIYNDAYAEILAATRFPVALGRPGPAFWGEAWLAIGPQIEQVLRGGEPILSENQPIRFPGEHGPEDSWWTYSFSPVLDETRPTGVGGVLAVATNVTAPLRSARTEQSRADRVIAAMSEGFVMLDREYRVVEINAAGLALDGRAAQEIVGRRYSEVWPAMAGTPVAAAYRQARDGREPVTLQQRYVFGGRETWLDVKIYPLDDGMAVFFRNVTAAKRAQDALRESEARLRLTQEVGGVGSYEWNLATGELIVSDVTRRIWGWTQARAPTLADVVTMIHPDDRPGAMVSGRAPIESQIGSAEYRILRANDGELRWLARQADVIRDADGRPARVVGALFDITERKLAEEHRELLINELNHRVKNTLATVQSFAHQTLRAGRSADEARDILTSRLVSLAAAHNVLTRSNWDSALMGDIVETALRPFVDGPPSRITAEGPVARLSPKVALAIALALHELATNAAKYGALSRDGGRVALSWRLVRGRRLELTWRETGGPPVVKPSRPGFGARLLERGLAADLGHPARLSFEPEGLICTIEAPFLDPEEPENPGRD